MKVLILVVAAAALGATALTVVLGTRLAEPTVVANPYEEALRHDVHHRAPPDRSAAASERVADARDELALEIEPRPPRALSELTFTVRATRDGKPLEGAAAALSLTMPGMAMGENRVPLAPAGPGVYRGKGAVVRCPSGGRAWAADVTVTPPGGAPLARRFGFEVADR
jgi:hypothetical protein